MPVSEKKRASNARWDEKNLHRTSLAVSAELWDDMQAYIKMSGETMNGFIKDAIKKKIYPAQ